MSEINGIEKPSKNNLLQNIIKQSVDKPVTFPKETSNDFEKNLFSNGTLDFDFDQYISEAKQDLGRTSQWLKDTKWEKERSTELLANELNSAKYEMIWRKRFSGQIPKQWDIWYNVMEDFEEAKNQSIKLSEVLIDAGVSHPHHLVANEVGKGQMLNVKQMAWLFARPDFPNWNLDEILDSQRKMGVSEEDIQEAVKLAEETKKNLEKRIGSEKNPKEIK